MDIRLEYTVGKCSCWFSNIYSVDYVLFVVQFCKLQNVFRKLAEKYWSFVLFESWNIFTVNLSFDKKFIGNNFDYRWSRFIKDMFVVCFSLLQYILLLIIQNRHLKTWVFKNLWWTFLRQIAYILLLFVEDLTFNNWVALFALKLNPPVNSIFIFSHASCCCKLYNHDENT